MRLVPMRRLGMKWGARYRRAFAGYRPDWSALRFSDGRPIPYFTPPPASMPELGVLEVRDARVLGVDGWAVVGRDRLIADAAFIHESPEFQHFRYLDLEEPIHLPGTTLNLASTFSNNNYGHALLDGLGRLSLTDAAGISPSDADWILVPQFWPASLNQLLAAAGGDVSRTISVSDRSQFAADKLIQPQLPGLPRVYPRSTPPFFRRLVAPAANPSRRLLAVRTGGRRAVRNSRELLDLANKHDVELYDPMQSPFPPSDFAQANLFISGHGADLSDIVFMRPGTTVIELLPSRNRYPYFGTLAISGELSYHAIDCPSIGEDHSDFDVNVDQLDRVLSSLA